MHAGLHAFPFHVLSVALHALVSMLVLALAQHLFAKLEVAAGWANPQADSNSSVATAAAAAGMHTGSSSSSSSSVMSRLLMWQQQPELWLRPVTWARQVQALIAAALFALHPVHTEVRSQHSAFSVPDEQGTCFVWILFKTKRLLNPHNVKHCIMCSNNFFRLEDSVAQ
jgi:hypothetical protein